MERRKMKLKRALLLIFMLVAAAVIGALLATIFADISFLSWMGFSRTIGISPDSPLVVDLSVVRFSFGFTTTISVAQVLCVALAIVLYNVITKKR